MLFLSSYMFVDEYVFLTLRVGKMTSLCCGESYLFSSSRFPGDVARAAGQKPVCIQNNNDHNNLMAQSHIPTYLLAGKKRVEQAGFADARAFAIEHGEQDELPHAQQALIVRLILT